MRKLISNNYRLTDTEIENFKKIFPYTRGVFLEIKFGLNLNQISRLRNKFKLRKNDYVPILSPEEVERFENQFFSFKNEELIKRFKITRSQLNYLRKNLGIRKRKLSIAS